MDTEKSNVVASVFVQRSEIVKIVRLHSEIRSSRSASMLAGCVYRIVCIQYSKALFMVTLESTMQKDHSGQRA